MASNVYRVRDQNSTQRISLLSLLTIVNIPNGRMRGHRMSTIYQFFFLV